MEQSRENRATPPGVAPARARVGRMTHVSGMEEFGSEAAPVAGRRPGAWHRIRTMLSPLNGARGRGRPAKRTIPKAPTVVMLDLSPPPLSAPRPAAPRRVVIRATRPALNDLRFTGDACVIGEGARAAVCLGDYRMGQLAVTPLDVPSLNNTFWQIRLGQARRSQARRQRRAAKGA